MTEEIGLASVFREINGYYADALGLATVVLPTGWQERLLPLTDADGKLRAYCLETHDACVSKLMAGREKDFAFILDLLSRQLISVETLAERAHLISEMPQKEALLPRLENLDRAAREARRQIRSTTNSATRGPTPPLKLSLIFAHL
ncbi:MAG: DUF6036 family nucleotidyltransferase [Pyrinomonadaceae bacterium]